MVYSFSNDFMQGNLSYMCWFCVSLERRGATTVILIKFAGFTNLGASSTLIIMYHNVRVPHKFELHWRRKSRICLYRFFMGKCVNTEISISTELAAAWAAAPKY